MSGDSVAVEKSGQKMRCFFNRFGKKKFPEIVKNLYFLTALLGAVYER